MISGLSRVLEANTRRCLGYIMLYLGAVKISMTYPLRTLPVLVGFVHD